MLGAYSFHFWSGVSLVALLILAALIGRSSEAGSILVDHRGRYSLTHLQLVTWTIVILATLLGVLIASGFDPEALVIPPELLGLMGVSAGSGVLGTAVKGAKDASDTLIARKDAKIGKRTIEPRVTQIWLEEEGDKADKVVNVTKFQNFVFTVIGVAFYVTLSCKTAGLPELPENVVWLLGISHAGYVGGKMPDRGTEEDSKRTGGEAQAKRWEVAEGQRNQILVRLEELTDAVRRLRAR